MDQASFRESSSGSLVRIAGGHYAFVPDKFPPDVAYSEALVATVHEAAAALGGVASIADFVPNPRLLVIPFLNLEAVLSSRIEGTISTTEEVFEADFSAPEEVRQPTREVVNYLRAMYMGMDWLNERPICLPLVRALHDTLLTGVRGKEYTPGQFRDDQVHIGIGRRPIAEAIYVPPPAHLLPGLLDMWDEFIGSERKISALVQCAIMHAQFEMIHPFSDGNGRIGRLLMGLFLIARGHLPQPMLFLSAYFERYRDEYYARLLAVSREGDWLGWIEFFLAAVVAQSKAAVEAARSMVALRNEVQQQLRSQRSNNPMQLVDMLFSNPITTIRHVSNNLGISFPAASRQVHLLVDCGFLVESTGHSRNQRFVAVPLIEAINRAAEPPVAEPSVAAELSPVEPPVAGQPVQARLDL